MAVSHFLFPPARVRSPTRRLCLCPHRSVDRPARPLQTAAAVVQIRVLDPDDFVETVQSEHLAPAPVSADGVRGKPHVWRASHETADQPLFLHESTSRALGMVAGDVPDLVDSVLGTGQLKGQRQKVRGLVMRPPPPDVAAEISTAIRCEWRQPCIALLWPFHTRSIDVRCTQRQSCRVLGRLPVLLAVPSLAAGTLALCPAWSGCGVRCARALASARRAPI